MLEKKNEVVTSNGNVDNTVINAQGKASVITEVKNLNSFISQRQIFDRSTNSVSKFVVLSSPTFKKEDWISVGKLMDIDSKMVKLPLEYNLKRTLKGDYDEGQKPQDGKAFNLHDEESIYKFDIYTQVHGRSWLLSHSHIVDKALFATYVRVTENDAAVNEAGKDQKSPADFSLGLG